ncbi:MAG: hypothetical protein LBQ15_10145 [Clostridium sp.]|jgi:hypothetical protein|nr:hypothetical protein [Clostridium sp.]
MRNSDHDGRSQGGYYQGPQGTVDAQGFLLKQGSPGTQGALGSMEQSGNLRVNGSPCALQAQCLRTVPAFFNAVYNGGAQDVPPEGEVVFLLAYQSGDFLFAPNTSVITVNTSGIYRIDYSLTLRPTIGLLNAAYAVAISEADHPFSFFGTYSDGLGSTERLQVGGMFLTDIRAGETVILRNKSSTSNHLSGMGIEVQTINRASILIQRIA